MRCHYLTVVVCLFALVGCGSDRAWYTPAPVIAPCDPAPLPTVRPEPIPAAPTPAPPLAPATTAPVSLRVAYEPY
jgi:hypothetical protein